MNDGYCIYYDGQERCQSEIEPSCPFWRAGQCLTGGHCVERERWVYNYFIPVRRRVFAATEIDLA